jgi:hypothetical protein
MKSATSRRMSGFVGVTTVCRPRLAFAVVFGPSESRVLRMHVMVAEFFRPTTQDENFAKVFFDMFTIRLGEIR